MWNRLILLSLVAITAFAGTEFERDEEVLVLTEDNFDEALEEFSQVLVEFYAPWCGHCKSLAPEYAKAAQMLKEENSEIMLAKVDATEQKELANKFEIRGFPTLKFFVDGEPSEYSGPRKAEGIVQWLKKRVGFPAERLTSEADIQSFIDDRKVAIVGFFPEEDSKSAKAFIEAARGDDDNEYAMVSDKALFGKFDVKDDERIVLFKKFDEKRNEYDESKYTMKKIKEFVDTNSMPLVIDFTMEVAQKVFGGKVKTHLFLFASEKLKELEEYRKVLGKIAESNRNKINVIFLNSDDEGNSRVTEFFGIDKDETPTLRLVNMDSKVLKYKPENEEISESAISAFVDEYNKGSLKPHLKSEDVPSDWDSKPVKVLVGKNFNEVAMDKSKDVFVEFYAPWCGHCKKLAPIWTELAEELADNNEIVIANFDATANEIEEVDIRGFPTLKLFKKDTNEVVDYNGERTLSAMLDFVENGGVESPEGDEEEEGQKDEL